jgi:butyryl-CoA dehydrogenase
MDWNLSEDHKIIKETVSKIAQKELVPKAAEIDKSGSFVWEGFKKLKEADVLGLAIPSEYGGMGMDILSEEKMGLNGTSTRELFFQDCRVPKENLSGNEGEGLKIVSQVIIGFGFLGAAAISLGIAQAALDASLKHAKERVIAGNPIGANQLIQSLITEMSLGGDTARALLYSAALRRDINPPLPIVDALKVKLYASEIAIDITNKAIQIHGGHGYCRDLPIERYYRDARGLALHFKTTELLKADIGKMLIGI